MNDQNCIWGARLSRAGALRKRHSGVMCFFLCLQIALAAAAFASPVVTNVRGDQRRDVSRKVDVYYDLSERAVVRLEVSADGGTNWNVVPVQTVNPAAGSFVAAGNGNHILWDAGSDWPGQFSSAVRFKVTAAEVGPAPGGMVLIPGGTNAGTDPDFGAYSLTVTSFYMDRYEVTKALWDEVQAWGLTNGYTDLGWGTGKGEYHPISVHDVDSCMKWCNARSEKEGRPTSYRLGGNVYRTGQSGWMSGEVEVICNMSVSGYRLPSEKEWEYAARGGLIGQRFPWGDEITHSLANYYSSSNYSYDTSTTRGYHPLYNTGDDGSYYTSPVGAFAPNGYGLHDMAGNVYEWCFRGDTDMMLYWVGRGGSWDDGAVGSASYMNTAWGLCPTIGFRAVLPPGQPTQPLSVAVSPLGGTRKVNTLSSWEAVGAGGSPPYAYQWAFASGIQTSNAGVGTLNAFCTTIGQKWVRVVVTDAGGGVAASATNFFTVSFSGGGIGEN